MTTQERYLKRLSKHLFWDIDPKQLNLDTCPSQIIQRVLEYGRWEDWLAIREYYGLPRIVEACKAMRTLHPMALSYICTISNTKEEDYRCYHFAQSNPTLWNS